MIIVTGGAGFIGSNLVHELNRAGEKEILVVDNLAPAPNLSGAKFLNLEGAQFADFMDKREFRAALKNGDFEGEKIRAILHQGACSNTLEDDGRYMMDNNFRYSRAVLDACLAQGAQFLYASSAAIYGGSTRFVEDRAVEAPLNVYGYSKFLFDQLVRRVLPAATSQIAGFRYFNVYGPRESHKGRMASVAFHNFNQFRAEGKVKLFGEYNGYAAGEQTRDFVSVEDVAKVNLFFFDHPEKSGIFNLGTGRAQPFNDIASSVVNTLRALDGQAPLSLAEMVQSGLIEYVPFPDALRGKYQCFTQADPTRLRAAGYDAPFLTVQEGVDRYVRWLSGQL